MTHNILIVDDEKNIRTTIRYALEGNGRRVDTTADGAEALAMLAERPYAMMLLDLRMPGMDGMAVLQEVRHHYPQTSVAIITAHGTVGSAVEAMKLGAVDFIQKPFSPQEIRDLVSGVLARREAVAELDYNGRLSLARRLLKAQDRTAALDAVKQAVALDPTRPEAFNLLGVLAELAHDPGEAQKSYRVALDLDPRYDPARDNMNRLGDRSRRHESPNMG